MKNFLLLLLLIVGPASISQVTMELTPQGFASFTIPKPDVPAQRLEDRIRGWVSSYNEKNEFGYDIYDVSEGGLSIDAHKRNAFFYRNKGEVFQHRIKYTMRIEYLETNIKVQFSVAEVYAKKNRIELTVADLFAPDGRLKDDYLDAKPSLEKTASKIVNSFADYMAKTQQN
ncbi:MAG: hypothetical protein EOP06_20725 [Proteobacteria bacterium]|nr:MAG: hypothetical protein EOP06_20725 [Pseudomonadota bacterium]